MHRGATVASCLTVTLMFGASQAAHAAEFVVVSTADGGPGSLRQAITDADAAPGADRVVFAQSATGTITLATALPAISEALEIEGPGANVLTVRRDPAAASSFRVLLVNHPAGDATTIAGLTLSGGDANTVSGGGGIAVAGGAHVLVSHSVVSGNHATGSGGGLDDSNGTLDIRDSTISGNSSDAQHSAGGVDTVYPLTITDSTVTANTDTATGSTGGVGELGTTVVVDGSTIAQNTGGAGAGSAANIGRHTSILGSTIDVSNSIVAGTAASNCTPGVVTSLGHNIDDGTSCGFAQTGDRQSTDPQLGPLLDNGGPTPTMALGPNSPAIDGGATTRSSDQRGSSAPVDDVAAPNAPAGNASDVGAYEYRQPLTVTNTNDSGSGSLRRNIQGAISDGGATITIAPSVSGTITPATPLPALSVPIEIIGPGAGNLTIHGPVSGGGVFDLSSGVPVTISGLTIAGGSAADGAGIHAAGPLTLSDSVITANSASGHGGGIWASGGLVLVDSTIDGNSAALGGGGIYTAQTLTMERSTVSRNTAATGAAGIDVESASALIAGSTIAANTSGGLTGGLLTSGALGTVIRNSTIAGNRAGPGGAANLARGPGTTLSVGSTIIGMRGDPQPNCSAALASAGFNLETGASCGLAGAADLASSDPLLGPLGDHGGPTQTLVIGALSPALDRGLRFSLQPASAGFYPGLSDQRGRPLPSDLADVANAPGGDAADIGAIEWTPGDVGGEPLAPGDGAPPDTTTTPAPGPTPDPCAAPAADLDRDGLADLCDPDDDNDGVPDAADRCKRLAGPAPTGCPTAKRTLTLRFTKKTHTLSGVLAARGAARCAAGETIRIYRVATRRHRRDIVVTKTTTTAHGSWSKRLHSVPSGRYYATALARTITEVATCGAIRSSTAKVGH